MLLNAAKFAETVLSGYPVLSYLERYSQNIFDIWFTLTCIVRI